MAIEDQVGQLLAESETARQHAMRKGLKQANPEGFRLRIFEAREARLAAHALDPDHTAPAWAEEQKRTPTAKDTHTELLRFYNHQLRESA